MPQRRQSDQAEKHSQHNAEDAIGSFPFRQFSRESRNNPFSFVFHGGEC
jgi:hypothetical protein